jgi:2,3-bisphosphoglycerate-dependent phosphoglycerate mutase
MAQAQALADRLADCGIDYIVSSPFVRARASIAPLAHRRGLPVLTDARLVERVLSPAPLPDWEDRLRAAFADPDLCLPGGESGRAAQQRVLAAVADIRRGAGAAPVLVSHGNLIALLLQHFDARFDFAAWRRLTNPDVFLVTLAPAGATVTRIWR